MNKVLKISNVVLLAINTLILFSCYSHIIDFSFTRITICTFIALTLLIISLIQLKKNSPILKNLKYNSLLFFVNIITLVIFMRDLFDPLIPLGSVYDIVAYNTTSSGIFIDYNAPFITIMYLGLLLYNWLNKDIKN